MLEAMAVLMLLVVAVGAPLAWRVAADRRRERALTVEARVRAAAREALGGESLLSVHVEPPGALHRGQVRLSAPRGWETLIEPVWKSALESTPEDYELVLAPGRAEDRPVRRDG